MLPMEKATYRAKAINAGLGIGDNVNAHKYVAVGFEVVDHDQLNGETITGFLFFSDKTVARTIESLHYLGFKSDDLSLLEDIGPEQCAEHLPNVVEIVCEPEEYQGEWQLKVKWVNNPGRGRFKAKQPLVGNDLKAFAAQMKGVLRNASAPRSAPAPQQRQLKTASGGGAPHPNAPGGDFGFDRSGGSGDIPF